MRRARVGALRARRASRSFLSVASAGVGQPVGGGEGVEASGGHAGEPGGERIPDGEEGSRPGGGAGDGSHGGHVDGDSEDIAGGHGVTSPVTSTQPPHTLPVQSASASSVAIQWSCGRSVHALRPRARIVSSGHRVWVTQWNRNLVWSDRYVW